MRINISQEVSVIGFFSFGVGLDDVCRGVVAEGTVIECTHVHAVAGYGFGIDVGYDELRTCLPAWICSKQRAVFGNQQFGIECEIGARFAESCRSIYISRHAAG